MKKTIKMFDEWHEQKKTIEFGKLGDKSINVGEFWWYREGINIGNEISKDGFFKRTCLVLNNRLGNGLYLIVPITTKYHIRMQNRLMPVYHYQHYGLKECRMILNQIKMIDKKRFVHKTNQGLKNKLLADRVSKQYAGIVRGEIAS